MYGFSIQNKTLNTLYVFIEIMQIWEENGFGIDYIKLANVDTFFDLYLEKYLTVY